MSPYRAFALALLVAAPALALADDRRESQFKAVVKQTANGFEVAAVAPNSVAASMGLKVGDKIESIRHPGKKDAVAPRTFTDLNAFLDGTKGYYEIKLTNDGRARPDIKGTVADSPFNKNPKMPVLVFSKDR